MDIRNFFSKKKGASSSKKEPKKESSTHAESKTKEEKKRKEVSPQDFFGETAPPAKRPSPHRSEKNSSKKQEVGVTDKKEELNYFATRNVKKEAPATSKPQPAQKEESKKKRALSKSPLKDKTVNPPAKKEPPTLSASKPISARDEPTQQHGDEDLPKPKKKRVSASPAPKLFKVEEITEQESFDMTTAKSLCLEGLTFCCSGVLDGLDRTEVTDMIKTLGGRVTGNVSSKTHYLILGSVLEDGRPVEQGKKYQRASTEANCSILRGTCQLYGLLQKYSGPVSEAKPVSKNGDAQKALESKLASNSVATKKPPPANPYASKPTNPYAQKKSNPYASNPYATKPTSTTSAQAPTPTKSKAVTKSTGDNDLWVDKYKPSASGEILGNGDSVKKLANWLLTWEDRFNNPKAGKIALTNKNGPWKAALLSGPPGIGKTTTAMVVANENGRDVLEFNASDVRSKKALQDKVGDITGSSTLSFSKKTKTKRCIIMDEVDGMGAGDRSGISELIQMIKKSKVPIICICNDRQSQKLKSLVPYCMDLKYRRPVKSVIARRAMEVAGREGLNVEPNAVEAIVESCGNDIRQVLNCLQMWSSKVGDSLSYKALQERGRSINKDEMLRVSMFDATRIIVEGRRGLGANPDAQAERSHYFRRNDAYFVDYNFVGLMVHQNYLAVMQQQYNQVKRNNNSSEMLEMMNRVHGAAESMSDWALCEERVRSAQAWSLLPVSAAMVVRTGSLAGGNTGSSLPGFPEFTTYLGRMSSRSKKIRLLAELGFHLNYKIQGGRDELRMSYLPTFRSKFMAYLKVGDAENVERAISLMDEYGLDRSDIFERFDEFEFDSILFDKLDSKTKAALTRTYNQKAHKSQALVIEQGAGPKKRKATSSTETISDPDAIDDDNEVDDDKDIIDDEADAENIRSMFKSKRKKGGKKATTQKKPKAKKKS